MEGASKVVNEFALKEEHTKLMVDAGCNIDRLIEFRHDVHKNPELGFKEFETSRKVKEHLLLFGLEEASIKSCAGTGYVVDIVGTGEPVPICGP